MTRTNGRRNSFFLRHKHKPWERDSPITLLQKKLDDDNIAPVGKWRLDEYENTFPFSVSMIRLKKNKGGYDTYYEEKSITSSLPSLPFSPDGSIKVKADHLLFLSASGPRLDPLLWIYAWMTALKKGVRLFCLEFSISYYTMYVQISVNNMSSDDTKSLWTWEEYKAGIFDECWDTCISNEMADTDRTQFYGPWSEFSI
jgi:hypothetical protein